MLGRKNTIVMPIENCTFTLFRLIGFHIDQCNLHLWVKFKCVSILPEFLLWVEGEESVNVEEKYVM